MLRYHRISLPSGLGWVAWPWVSPLPHALSFTDCLNNLLSTYVYNLGFQRYLTVFNFILKDSKNTLFTKYANISSVRLYLYHWRLFNKELLIRVLLPLRAVTQNYHSAATKICLVHSYILAGNLRVTHIFALTYIRSTRGLSLPLPSTNIFR